MPYHIDDHLFIAIVAAFVNIILSLFIPPLISDSDLPFTQEIKNHYDSNKNIILVSSFLTIVLVYISLKVSPYVKSKLLNLSELNAVPKYA